MNPMIRKELRQRMRERRSWILPTLYLLALGAAVSLAYWFTTQEAGMAWGEETKGAQVGVAVFLAVAFTQLGLLLLLAPVFSAGSITIEKEQRTLAGLLTSLLSSREIWWGKFVSAMLFVILLLVTSLPVLSLVFSLGGVGPQELARATGMTLLVLASISAMSLYFSSVFRRSVHSTAVSYAAVIAITVVTFVVCTILESRWQAHRPNVQTSAQTTQTMPEYINAPLYLNPFYALARALTHGHEKFPVWLRTGLVFAVLGVAAFFLAVRNLRRSGEQG